jgi:ACT domain-containing protein
MYRVRKPPRPLLSETILTAFHRQVWRDLWYLEISCLDEVGILARLCSHLKSHKINILTLNNMTANQGAHHVIRLSLDCRKYDNGPDLSNAERRDNPAAQLGRLEREITLKFIKEIRFLGSRPAVFIRRNHALWRFDRDLDRLDDEPVQRRLQIQQSSFKFPEEDLLEIAEAHARYFQRELADLGPAQVLSTAQPSSEVCRLLVFFRNLGVVPLSLSIDNEPGAISSIVSVLSESNCNILAGKSWTGGHYSRTFLWLLLEDRTASPGASSDSETIQRIAKWLEDSKQISVFRPKPNQPLGMT